MVNSYRAKMKKEVGVKVHLLWLEKPGEPCWLRGAQVLGFAFWNNAAVLRNEQL